MHTDPTSKRVGVAKTTLRRLVEFEKPNENGTLSILSDGTSTTKGVQSYNHVVVLNAVDSAETSGQKREIKAIQE